ncbi:MAG: serine hydrolase [Anaerolineae bacterium]|nr:serine hydrolase [Anaerolineae bacterium]
MSQHSDCIFCQIAAGQAPASIVYQDEAVVAFMDLNQPNSGKVLIIPCRHVQSIYDLDDDLAAALCQTAVHIARAIKGTIQPQGINLFQANGCAAGQDVFHFHLHILPRYENDRVIVRWPTHTLPRADLDRLAETVRAGLPDRAFTDVDRLMRANMGRVAPSAVLKIVHDGRTIFERAYGFIDPLDEQYPTQPDSVFDLASVSKLFTVTAFFRLVRQNKVSIATPVSQVLPRFNGPHVIGGTQDPITKQPVAANEAFAGQMVERGEITFRHLLTHTSGLAAWRSLYREVADTSSLQPADVPADVRDARIAHLFSYPFIYPSGEQLVYSDLGLILLGEAVAALSNEPLDKAVCHLVLEPLGIADQVWYNPLACGVARERIVPTEYGVWRNRRLLGEVHDENAAGLGGIAGHAGLFATAHAVAALGQLYLNGGVFGGERLLDVDLVAESVREQVRFDTTRRGLGWVLYDPPLGAGGTAFGHTGYTGTSLYCIPERNVVVVLLTNRVYYGRDWEGIFRLRLQVYASIVKALEWI